jgi:uncharacterized protein (TIGR00251 family)
MAEAPRWWSYDPRSGRGFLTVHVQPNARSSAIAGVHGDALRIRIAAPAVDDKANAALLAYLCDRLGMRRSEVAIRHGARGRRKTIEIVASPAGLPDLLRRLAPP